VVAGSTGEGLPASEVLVVCMLCSQFRGQHSIPAIAVCFDMAASVLTSTREASIAQTSHNLETKLGPVDADEELSYLFPMQVPIWLRP
jgi:hypothetical protein